MSGRQQTSTSARANAVAAVGLWGTYLALDTGSQLAFKWAGDSVGAGALDLGWIVRAMTAPSLWIGVACYIGTLVIWMRVLARMDLSRAFPMSGLSYVTVPMIAIAMFGESLAPLQVVGIVAICAGVALLALEQSVTTDRVFPSEQEN